MEPAGEQAVTDQEQKTRKRRERKNKKADPEAHHRLRLIAFVMIVVVLLSVMATMIASRLLPEYEILNLPRKAIAWVMEPVQTYFSSGTGWFFDYLHRLKLRSNI